MVLDTSALIDLSRGSRSRRRSRVRERVAELVRSGESPATTRLNVAEMWVGVERSVDRDAELRKVQAVLQPLAVLELDVRGGEAFGTLVAHLQERGAPIGDMDCLIAAVCLAHGEPILTGNPSHFDQVPALTVLSY